MINGRTNPVSGDPRGGYSTITMLVALTLLVLVLGPVLGTVLSGQRGFVSSWEKTRTADAARYAHLALTRQMRFAGSHPVGSPVQGIDPDPRGDGVFDDIRLRADYNPPDGDINDPGEDVTYWVSGDTLFVQEAGNPEEPHLLGVDSLAFEYYDRDGVVITDPDLVPARTVSVKVTVRARTTLRDETMDQVLVGQVRLRNRR